MHHVLTVETEVSSVQGHLFVLVLKQQDEAAAAHTACYVTAVRSALCSAPSAAETERDHRGSDQV